MLSFWLVEPENSELLQEGSKTPLKPVFRSASGNSGIILAVLNFNMPGNTDKNVKRMKKTIQGIASGLLLLLCGCVVHLPEPSAYKDLQRPETVTEEALLLDIGISPFVSDAGTEEDDPALADIRRAESRYMPVVLQHTFQETGHWGEINVLPDAEHHYDVGISGRIIESNSHTLRLEVTVHDASGSQWFRRRYTEYVGNNVYGDHSLGVNDPFQGLYNRIANDLLLYRQEELTDADIARLRQTAQLRFGMRFAPALYQPYLQIDRRGTMSVVALPPLNDPVHARILEISGRDREFHSALQRHYFNYARSISDTYFDYRRFSYLQVKDLHDQQSQARGNLIEGVFWLGVAAATADIDNAFGSTVSTVAALGGAGKLYQGVAGYPSSDGALEELSESFANDVQTEVVELDQDVIILTGSVEELYAQWQDILNRMYEEDRGLQVQP